MAHILHRVAVPGSAVAAFFHKHRNRAIGRQFIDHVCRDIAEQKVPGLPLLHPGQSFGKPETTLHRLQLGVGRHELIQCWIKSDHIGLMARCLRFLPACTYRHETENRHEHKQFLHRTPQLNRISIQETRAKFLCYAKSYIENYRLSNAIEEWRCSRSAMGIRREPIKQAIQTEKSHAYYARIGQPSKTKRKGGLLAESTYPFHCRNMSSYWFGGLSPSKCRSHGRIREPTRSSGMVTVTVVIHHRHLLSWCLPFHTPIETCGGVAAITRISVPIPK